MIKPKILRSPKNGMRTTVPPIASGLFSIENLSNILVKFSTDMLLDFKQNLG